MDRGRIEVLILSGRDSIKGEIGLCRNDKYRFGKGRERISLLLRRRVKRFYFE